MAKRREVEKSASKLSKRPPLPWRKILATEMTNHKVLHADMQGERAITRELFEDELGLLNLIVDQYLSFAEAQARQKKVMTPTAWIDNSMLNSTRRKSCRAPARCQSNLPTNRPCANTTSS